MSLAASDSRRENTTSHATVTTANASYGHAPKPISNKSGKVELGLTTSTTDSKQNHVVKLVTPTPGSASIKAQLKKQIALLKRQEVPTKTTTQPVKRKAEQTFSDETVPSKTVDTETKLKLRQEQKQASINDQITKLEDKLQPKKKARQHGFSQLIDPRKELGTFEQLGSIQLSGPAQQPDPVQPSAPVQQPYPCASPPIQQPHLISDYSETVHRQRPTVIQPANFMHLTPVLPMFAPTFPNTILGYNPPNIPLTMLNPSWFPINNTPMNMIDFRILHSSYTNLNPLQQSKNIHTKSNAMNYRNMNVKKRLIIHKEPMVLPSPYAKSHVLIPFEIQITKVKGQAFGLEIRYESQGTFVMFNEKVPIIKSSLNVSSEAKSFTKSVQHSPACVDTIVISNNTGKTESLTLEALDTNLSVQIPETFINISPDYICTQPAVLLSQPKENPMVMLSGSHLSEKVLPDSRIEILSKDNYFVDSVTEFISQHTELPKKMSSEASIIKISNESFGSAEASMEKLSNEFLGSTIQEVPLEISSNSTCSADTARVLQPTELSTGISSPRPATPIYNLPNESSGSLNQEILIDKVTFDKDLVGMGIQVDLMRIEVPIQLSSGLQIQAGSMENSSDYTNLVDSGIPSMSQHVEATPEIPSGSLVPGSSLEINEHDKCFLDPLTQCRSDKSMETSDIINCPLDPTSAMGKVLSKHPYTHAASSVVDQCSGSQTSSIEFATRLRKKRVIYGVMSVVNATKQNERMSTISQTAKEHMLQPGDIILQIDDTDICGLPFPEASSLFSKCSTYLQPTQSASDAEPIIVCRLRIAREKKILKVLEKLASLSSKSTEMNKSIAGKEAEIKSEIARKIMDLNAVIPRLFRDQISLLAKIDGIDLTNSIQDLLSQCDERIDVAASSFWEKTWAAEVPQSGRNVVEGSLRLTDSQRQRIRNLPKPLIGCKCGSRTHEYVFDIECPLYDDLRMYGTKSFIPKKEITQNKTGSTNIDEAIIQRQRYIEKKAEAEEQEAKFVEEMEQVQVSVFHKAIFAPRLALSMLLSAIVHQFNDYDCQQKFNAENEEKSAVNNIEDCSDDSDEDDIDNDVPLSALGVFHQSKVGLSAKYKVVPSLLSLARTIRFISNVWGHIYQEPEAFLFSWNEECKRAINKKGAVSSPSIRRNPRNPGTLTFEKFRFAIDDGLLQRLSGRDESSRCHFRDQLFVSYLASNKMSGILSDVFVFINAGVVRIDESSNLSLCPSWIANLPQIILNDMWESGWDVDSDIKNKFCISTILREKITRHWKRGDVGWSFDGKLKFRHDDFEEQKASFQVMYDERVNAIDGIGQFGV